MSAKARQLLLILKTDYVLENGVISLPPYEELCRRMGFNALPPLISCLRRLLDAGLLVIEHQH